MDFDGELVTRRQVEASANQKVLYITAVTQVLSASAKTRERPAGRRVDVSNGKRSQIRPQPLDCDRAGRKALEAPEIDAEQQSLL